MNEELLQDIKSLLKDVGAKVEKSNEIARLKGENFNIFSILGMETKENKTHSNFLASLLNPKGVHGLGDVFLRLFFKTIILSNNDIPVFQKREDDNVEKLDILGSNLNMVYVVTEKKLGDVNYENIEGGRIDILIEEPLKTWAILIENKIHAGDGYLQIARYCNSGNYENKAVFYLTLFGDKPDEGSYTGKVVNKHFFLLSYKTDIKNWLEKCQKEVSDYPIIRETIKQYLILIKRLTRQLTINEMAEKIYDSILKNIEAAQVISQNLEAAKVSVKIEYQDALAEKIIKKVEQDYKITTSSNKGFLHINIRKVDWHEDLKYLLEINPKNGYVYLTLVLDKKSERDASFYEQVKKILGSAYFVKWACISELIEITVLSDQFIGDYYTIGQSDKDKVIDESADKILDYINSMNDKVDKICGILKRG